MSISKRILEAKGGKMKKLIFLLVFLFLPAGVKAQEIIKCDTTVKCRGCLRSYFLSNPNFYSEDCFQDTIIHCDTNWIELRKFVASLDSVIIIQKVIPNWQDSIEQCREEILVAEQKLNQAQKELLNPSNSAELYGEIEFLCRTYNDAKYYLYILNLQLQIYQLRAILQKAGLGE